MFVVMNVVRSLNVSLGGVAMILVWPWSDLSYLSDWSQVLCWARGRCGIRLSYAWSWAKSTCWMGL